MSKHKQLQHFVNRWQMKINRHRLLQSISCGLLAMAGGVLVVCVVFLWQGQAVRPRWFMLPVGVGVVIILAAYLLWRLRKDQAVHHADDAFEFKQGLVSACFFARQGNDKGIYHLQTEQTVGHSDKIDLKGVRLSRPWGKIIVTCIMVVIAAWLCSFDDSPAVASQKAQARLTETKTSEIKEYLKEAIEELKKELTDEEKNLFEKSKLAEMVNELKVTQDYKEALRQYASIEKKLCDYSARLSAKRDEAFAAALAEQLQKSKKTQQLGNKLAAKKYRQAGTELKKLSQKSDKNFQQAKKDFDKLSDLTDRMAGTCNETENMNCDLKEQTAELCKQAEELKKALQELEKKECQSGSCQGGKNASELGECDRELKELANCQGSVNEALADFACDLNDLDARKRFLLNMDKMREKLCKSQKYMVCSSVSLASQKGIGKRADGSMNNKTAESTEKTQAAQVNPLLGDGPSQIAVQDAQSGTGTSRMSSTARDKKFRRQVEALVNREDVPADLKDGVKNYFQIIHEYKDRQVKP